MTSPAKEFQGLVWSTLTNDAALMNIITAVYDRVPESKQFPYVSIGTINSVANDAECIRAADHTMDVHVWLQPEDNVGKATIHDVCDIVKRLFHEAENLTITDNALSRIRAPAYRVFRDSDGLTEHGVITVTARIEER